MREIPPSPWNSLIVSRTFKVSLEYYRRKILIPKRNTDPHAEEKTLWVQAKRGVLAILRVQPAQDLLGSLMRPVTEDDELLWEDILETEIQNEARQAPRRQPSAIAAESAYRLEDIRSLVVLPFHAIII